MAYVTRKSIAVLALVSLSFAASAEAAPPVVTSVTPASQAIDVWRTNPIVVNFDQAIDSTTVNNITFKVFGRWSGPAAGTYTVANNVVTFTPDVAFFAGEWVTVSLSKNIKNFSAEGMALGYQWNFWARAGGGTLDLDYVSRRTTRTAGETWVQPYGAYAGDINNDGWSDLSIPCEQTSDVRVFMNIAGVFSGTMVKEALVNGSVPSPNEAGDFDNDGEIDLVVGNTANDKISVLFGDGTGDYPTARKTSYTASSAVRGVGVVDLNGDGWEDIVTANRFGNNMSIFINNGDGTFAAAVAKEAGGSGEYTIGVADANNDGLLDVFCSTFNSPYYMIILLSDGNGGLTAQTPVPAGGRPWQIVLGDYNGDGNVDVASANSSTNNMGVLFGNGLGGLSAAVTYATGSFPLAIDAGDVDGDGDLEIVSSNYDDGNWTMYENTGAGAFVNPNTLNAQSAGSCALLHDRDNDGDLDLTGFDEVDDWVYFYVNNPAPTGVNPLGLSPITLHQNHPNPFNPTTTIRFDLAKASSIDLSIFDARGTLVRTLAHGTFQAGRTDLRWDGTDNRGNRVGSGVYFYRIASREAVINKKMVLLK